MGKRCSACGGEGRRAYGSTSTWRGGIAGQSITVGTCDRCWGSGDEENPGEDLRRKEYEARENYQRRLREDPAFRWKECARRFARRAYTHRSNYREMAREVRRLHSELREIRIALETLQRGQG